MPPFEDLLQGRVQECKACGILGRLEPGLRAEVEAAMDKARYGDKTLAKGLTKVSGEYISPIGIKGHRERHGLQRPGMAAKGGSTRAPR